MRKAYLFQIVAKRKSTNLFVTILVVFIVVSLERYVCVNSFLQDSIQETRCLNCIRNVSSTGIDLAKRCEGYYCGPFQISYQYWAEAGKPGSSQGARDFEKCSRDRSCAEQTVRAYFKKFKRDCNNDGVIDCLDMAALHKAGPASCSSDWFYKSRFWTAFNKTSCAIDRTNEDDEYGLNRHKPMRIMKNQTLTSECLDCICEGVSNCSVGSNNCGSGTVCGPFAISQAYWKDGRRPGASWTACARTKECSVVTIKNYMEKYKRDCNGDGFITCEDYAAIHRRGPRACTNIDLLKEQYWTRFSTCRLNQKPMNDINLVKVNEDKADALTQNSLASRGASGTTITLHQSTQTAATATISDTASVSLTTWSTPRPTETRTQSVPTTASTTTTTTTTLSVSSSPRDDEDGFKLSNNHLRPNQVQAVHGPQHPTSLPATNRMPLSDSPTLELKSVTLNIKDEKNNVRQQTTFERSSTSPVVPTYTTRHQFGQINQDKNQKHVNLISQQASNISPNHESPATERPNIEAAYETQTTVLHQDSHQHKRPTIDYSSIPTIIVKPPRPNQQLPVNTLTTFPFPATTRFVPMTTSTTFEATTVRPSQSVNNLASQPVLSSEQQTSDYNPDQTQSSPYVSLPPLQEQTNVPPISPIIESETDLPMADFPFVSNGTLGGERVNFDKVVNDIFASPDFTKSYPPIPEALLQRKQTQNLSNESKVSNQASKFNHVKHIPAAVSSNKPANQSNAARSNFNPAKAEAGEGSIATNNANAILHQQPSDIDNGDGSSQSGGSLLGLDAINMTNLFEKGLNESSRIAAECLECICDASSNCDTTVQCISKQREKNRCGLYMISWNQYQESDISLTSLASGPPESGSSSPSKDDLDEKMYYECATDRNCAEKLIHLYIEKHQKDCNDDGKIDCFDIAAIHRVGPENCNSGKFLSSQYWKDFNICYSAESSTTTSQPGLQTPGR